MNAPHPTVSPLRQRMLEDMRMRRLAPKTQTAYIVSGHPTTSSHRALERGSYVSM